MERPRVEVVLAMSADGRIADTSRAPERIGSDEDHRHLIRRIAEADAVLFGASTLRAVGYGMCVRNPGVVRERERAGLSPQPLQLVVSRSADLPEDLRFFNEPTTRWLLTTGGGARTWGRRSGFDRVVVTEQQPGGVDWTSVLSLLAAEGVRRLSVLGGGETVAGLLQADLVDELWLTVCPVLIGGRGAPTPVDGPGLPLGSLPPLKLLSSEQVAEEVFLHYSLR
ncbi:riboflavin deaminase [Glycomyces fuscus]|nr:riboflavin deaminase [Glycomyces fuscus]